MHLAQGNVARQPNRCCRSKQACHYASETELTSEVVIMTSSELALYLALADTASLAIERNFLLETSS